MNYQVLSFVLDKLSYQTYRIAVGVGNRGKISAVSVGIFEKYHDYCNTGYVSVIC